MRASLMKYLLVSALSLNTAFADTPGEVKTGSLLREATLHRFDGGTDKFSDYKGKPLVINVWASWCGPCRAEMGSLDRLSRRYNGKELKVIGISTDDNSSAAVAFIKKSGITFDNFLDRKLLLENMLGANTIPLTILVDENGRVLKKIRGAREWDSPKIINAMEKIFHIKPDHDPMFGLHILSQHY